ncbi:hypothetical protein GCM10027340_09780 [Marinomonas epiphytica]
MSGEPLRKSIFIRKFTLNYTININRTIIIQSFAKWKLKQNAHLRQNTNKPTIDS